PPEGPETKDLAGAEPRWPPSCSYEGRSEKRSAPQGRRPPLRKENAMNKLARPGFIIPILFLLAASTGPAFADHPEAATPTDLRERRTEVHRLGDSLQMFDNSDT